MLTEPLTMYKLMILYLLKHVRFPLTKSQLSDLFLGKDYCTYYTFQQAIEELLDSHLMRGDALMNLARYEITREGEEALSYFGDTLSDSIIKDLDDFLDVNRIRLRSESGIVTNITETSEGEYLVTCEVREGKTVLVKLELTVPTRAQAEIMCLNWSESNQTIYAFAMKELLRD